MWPRELYLLPIVFFSRATPRFWQRAQNRLASAVLFRVWDEKTRVLARNLSVVLGMPEDDPLIRDCVRRLWLNYGFYMLDYVQMNRLGNGGPRHLVPEQKGIHFVEQSLAEGRGGILITPHLGHWELGGVTFAMRGCPIHALTLRDPEQKVQRYRDRMRSTLGIHSVHIDPNRYDTVLRLARLLRQNGFIAMLGDRWEGGKHEIVRFFGKNVVFPAGAPALALATGSPIIPVFTVMTPKGRYRAWAEPPIRVRRRPGMSTPGVIAEATQRLAGVFERIIARYPDQWYHFFDYWGRYGR